MGAVGGSISKNRPSHHKYKSPKQFLLIAYSINSGLNGQENLMQTGRCLFIPFLKTKIKWVRRQIGQAKNCIKETNSINIFAKLLLRAVNNDFLKCAY